MPIDFKFCDEDIRTINLIMHDYGLAEVSSKSIKEDSERRLAEAGIQACSVDLVRKPGNVICWGSTRLPLKVETNGQIRVLKPYDDYDKEREKCVLQVVSGIIAPLVFRFGSDFYLEEMLDHSKGYSLMQLANRGEVERAVEIGAGMHARLARLHIDYDHNHWLDEFHVQDDRELITDFGTSHYFCDVQQMSNYAKLVFERIREGRSEELLNSDGFIPCFNERHPQYEKTAMLMLNLNSDPGTLTNLFFVISGATRGIKRYLESKHGFSCDAWTWTMELFPDFVAAFSEEYKRSYCTK